MTYKERIINFKKLDVWATVLFFVVLTLNAAVWFVVLFAFKNNDFVQITVGLCCLAFAILFIIGVIIVGKIKTKKLKTFVEGYAGVVTDEDKIIAADLLKTWKSHYIKSIKWFFSEFRTETYPFGMKIIQDLTGIKNGLKVERSLFYDQLGSADYGDAANLLLSQICELVKNNSYSL